MDINVAILSRRSIRKFKSEPINDDLLDLILEAGRLAPSAANKQPWHFIVVKDKRLKEKLKEGYDEEWFYSAPLILIVCVDPELAWKRSDGEEYWKVDGAIAMQNIVLQAWEKSVGTCWIAAFNEQAVKQILHIPDTIRVVAMTPLGYPDEEKSVVKDRKPMKELYHSEKW